MLRVFACKAQDGEDQALGWVYSQCISPGVFAMSQWLNVASIFDFPPETFQVVKTDYESIIVANINGQYYAVQDVCSHDGSPLSDGKLEQGELVCPRHGAHFCLKTGEALTPPAYEPINTYPVRVVDNVVQVEIVVP